MRVRAGTSGYSYKAWKGNFYPQDLAAARMLEYYAARLPAVEVNNTFYRMPSPKMVAKWIEVAPQGFRFVLKATRRITHHAQLKEEAAELLTYVLETTAPLGERLGCHLFQLPPYTRVNANRLESFLGLLPDGQRAALEFRHDSWFVDEVFEVLRRHDAALVVSDGGKVEVPFETTASWGYLRLRRDGYDDEQLADWAGRVRQTGWNEAFVFFKHEDDGGGPRMARRFLELVGAPGT